MPGFGYNATWSTALPGGQNLNIPTVLAFEFYSAPTLAPSALSNQSFAAVFLVYSNVIALGPGSNTTTTDASKANPRVEFRAAELVWYWCFKSYGVSVHDGRTRRVETACSTRIVEDTTSTSPDDVDAEASGIRAGRAGTERAGEFMTLSKNAVRSVCGRDGTECKD